MEHLVTSQPSFGNQRLTWGVNNLSDEASVKAYNSLNVHDSHRGLREALSFQGSQLRAEAAARSTSIAGALTPESLVQPFLLPGEQPVCHVPYHRTATFSHPDRVLVDETPTHGEAILTDNRLLLVSASASESNYLLPGHPVKRGVGAARPKQYILKTAMSQVRAFSAFPIKACRDVSFRVESGVLHEVILDSEAADCDCGPCFGCFRSWSPSQSMATELHIRQINIDVERPPWGDKGQLQIHVRRDVQYEQVSHFVGELSQRMVPPEMHKYSDA